MVANKGHVLVVEDSIAAAKRLQMSLEQARFSVEIARNGQDAWDKAQRRQFNLIITDEQMPVMSGRELCKKLRGDIRYANSPIIILSAAEFGENQEDIDLRVTATFLKPFVPGELLRTVESLMSVAGQAKRKAADAATRRRSSTT